MRSSSDKTKTLGQDNVRYRVEKGEKQTNIHSVNSSLYFFNTTTNVTFFAYYPYIQSQGGNLLVNYTLPVNQTNQTDLARADIMYSSVLQANGAKPNVVLSFSHKMVLLSFKVSTRTSAVSKLTKITISGSKVTNTGTLDLSTGLIATKPAMASFVVNPNKDMSSAISAYVDVIINPCTIGNNNVVGSEEFKVTFTIELGSLAAHPSSTLNVVRTSLEGGKRYMFNITIA